tara:strand:- start:127 stop:402 length:276 start_codon:yes stop_codon:yes gene_type:complete
MSEKKAKKKAKKNEKRDYNIDDNKDYVIVLKPEGESKAFYPLDVVDSDPPAPIDARFVAVAHVLQDQESFEFVVNRFRAANGLTEEEETQE